MAKRLNKSTLRQTEEWYSQMRPTYESLTTIVCSTLEGLIKENKIDYLSVSGRTKTKESFANKIRSKGYHLPEKDIHDLSGIRIIVYTESDANKIADIVKDSFHVHPDKSLDKTSELGIDKAGYRSIHLVCDLGQTRAKLPEYAPYKDSLFEIQIRTVLQHAWAEIEHDRNYKFAGVLPDHLQRRLYLAAGTLEMVDREFDSLANAIDKYGQDVVDKTKKGKLDIPLNSTSLSKYLKTTFKNDPRIYLGHISSQDIISELHNYGINTISELDDIFHSKVVQQHITHKRETTDLGLLRNVMILADIDRYFKKSWNNHWKYTEPDSINLWTERYGKEKVEKLIEANKIIVDENFRLTDLHQPSE